MHSSVAPVKVGPLWREPGMRQLVLISLLGFASFCLTLAAVPTWAHAGGVGDGAAGLPTTVMLASTVLTQLFRNWFPASVSAAPWPQA